MIITKLQGGLGNQMFQYAAGKALSLYHQTELALETSFFLSGPTHELDIARNFEMSHFIGVNEMEVDESNKEDLKKFPFLKESKIQKLLPNYKRNVYKEPHYHFDTNFFKGKKKQYLKGHWHSEKFFGNYKNEIISALQLKKELVKDVEKHIKEHKNSETVSVHIRRGDYLRKPIILEWHGVMDKPYYANAFEALSKKTNIDKVFYFSDDPEWVEKELLPIMPGTIVSNGLSKSQYEDLYWMSQCKHNIVANSSFSWWGAWLNPNPNKIVIAPKRWYDKAPVDTKDLYPTGWLKV